MNDSTPQILAPGPGFPQLLDGPDDRIRVYVAATAPDAEIRRWAALVQLEAVAGGARHALALDAVTRLDATTAPAELAPALAVSPTNAAVIRLDFLAPPLPTAAHARYALFDLVAGERRIRSRCIALPARRDARLSLAFASDLHVAAIWGSIDDAIARYAPDLHSTFLHPGRLLRRFVEAANQLAAAGELDLIVLGGDLVDHVRPGPHASEVRSNVDHLIDLLDDLTVPTFAIPGNHDFRLHPWRPRIYPYSSVALPQRRAAQVLRRAGLWDATPWRLSDLAALRTTDEQGRTALADHLLRLAPSSDYEIDLDELRLVFLSTGRDVLPRWRSVEPGRRRILLRSLPGSWEHPDSEGLTLAQIGRAERALRGSKPAALFFHAPLFNPAPGARIEDHLARLAPSDADATAAFGRFERELARTGLRQGVFFRNPGALVRALSAGRRGAAVFSGHVHQPHAARFEPRSGSFRSVGFPWSRGDADEVLLANAPALGQTAMQNGRPPGFLYARFREGTLTEAHCRPVDLGANPHAASQVRERA